jgi:hypothetical protein
MILVRLWKRYVDFWNEREGPETLALVRITLALALIGNLLELLFSGMLLELYADPGLGGVFPDEGPVVRRPLWKMLKSGSPLSLLEIFDLPSTPFVVYFLFAIQLLAAICLLLGLGTRLAALVCFLVQVTFYERMRIWVFGGDNVYRVFLYLLVLSPSGAAWSLDARLRGKPAIDVPSWPRRLFIFQLTVIYVATGIMKIGSTWTILGGWSALYLALNLPGIARWSGDWAAWVYPLTQVGTFVSRWWEITFFLVPLNMWLRRRKQEGKKLGPVRRLIAWKDLRWPYMVLGLVFHVSLTILLDLGLFSIVMLSLYPCLLRPEEARRVLEFFANPHCRNSSNLSAPRANS